MNKIKIIRNPVMLEISGFLLFCFLIFGCNAENENKENKLKLWYDTPSSNWNEALPLGNGRLGAMVFGIPYEENIQLNELTLWSGGPGDNNNPEAKKYLKEIRTLLFEGKYGEAHNLANSKFITRISNGMPYETVGNLRLKFSGHEHYSNYYRELNIEDAVARTSYTVDGVEFKREAFTSFTDQVVVIRLTASEKGKINFTATMDRPKPSVVSITTDGNNILKMNGKGSDVKGKRLPKDTPAVKGKIKFQSILKIVPDGGTLTSNDSLLTLKGANSATLYVSIATNFVNYKDVSGDEQKRSEKYIANAEKKSYSQLLNDHESYYRNLFNRVSLNLGKTDSIKNTTDVRIKDFNSGNDPDLAALFFQFGRYLLICSSQPGGQPSTLQGIWNNQLTPPWKSAYTVNINTEMNYWPAEKTNLAEMHEPYINMLKELSVTGKKTAKEMYDAKGWTTHHNTDIWRICGPVDGATWGMWPTGGMWLSQQLWERYMYNGDKEYLKSVYPILKGSAEFCMSFLTPEPNHGWMIISPSISPEHHPEGHPKMANIAYDTTMDNQLSYDILTRTAMAAQILNTDSDFVKKINSMVSRLAPMQIGKYSQLQEWLEDWDDRKDNHRHVSHLYGLFPSNQISPYSNPKLFEAAKNSLIYRGDPSTGWSMTWKINLWARLMDGNHAYKLICNQLKLVGEPKAKRGGGTYANMFDSYPPFQIDANFGYTSGVTEMLLQSYDGAIQLIPALPDVWKETGKVTGLRALGGFEIKNLEREKGNVIKVSIKSNLGGNCRIRSYNELTFADGKKLQKSKGENKNPFYKTPIIKKPVISEKATFKGINIPKIYSYDIETKPGETINLIDK